MIKCTLPCNQHKTDGLFCIALYTVNCPFTIRLWPWLLHFLTSLQNETAISLSVDTYVPRPVWFMSTLTWSALHTILTDTKIEGMVFRTCSQMQTEGVVFRTVLSETRSTTIGLLLHARLTESTSNTDLHAQLTDSTSNADLRVWEHFQFWFAKSQRSHESDS